MKSRRGSLFDMIWLTIASVTLVMGILLIYLVGTSIHTALPTDLLNSGPNGASSDPFTSFDNLNGLLDGLVIFVIVASGIGSAVLAKQVNQNPGYWILGIIFIACMNIVWMAMHDTLIAFMGSSLIAPVADHFPLITIFVTYLPLWFIVFSVIIAWATWGKQQNQYGFA